MIRNGDDIKGTLWLVGYRMFVNLQQELPPLGPRWQEMSTTRYTIREDGVPVSIRLGRIDAPSDLISSIYAPQ